MNALLSEVIESNKGFLAKYEILNLVGQVPDTDVPMTHAVAKKPELVFALLFYYLASTNQINEEAWVPILEKVKSLMEQEATCE